MGAAGLIIPLIPGMVQMVMNLIDAAKAAEGTPEQMKVQLDVISADLKSIVAAVEAVDLPSGK